MSNSSERSKPLGFDLRARIAAIQVGHYPWLYDRTLACTCGEYRSEPDLFRQWGDHVADVLIRELKLHVVTVGHFQTVIKGSYPTPLEETDD